MESPDGHAIQQAAPSPAVGAPASPIETPGKTPPILEGFERLAVKGAETGEWDVPSGIVPTRDAAKAVEALRVHHTLGLKRRAAAFYVNILVKLNEKWPADQPAPSVPLEDLFVYVAQMVQPGDSQLGSGTSPQSTSPIKTPTLEPNQVSLWIPHGKTASIGMRADSTAAQQMIVRTNPASQPPVNFDGTGGTGVMHAMDGKTTITVAGGAHVSLEFNSRNNEQASWAPSRVRLNSQQGGTVYQYGADDVRQLGTFVSSIATVTIV